MDSLPAAAFQHSNYPNKQKLQQTRRDKKQEEVSAVHGQH